MAFRFRAAAALELRRQQEQTAAGALAAAERALNEARSLRERTELGRREAMTRQIDAEREGADGAQVGWHRNWISRLSATVDRLSHDVEQRTQVVGEAERAWRDARRRRLALERMRDRAVRRYQMEQHRLELKAIDELARLRHLMAGEFWGDES